MYLVIRYKNNSNALIFVLSSRQKLNKENKQHKQDKGFKEVKDVKKVKEMKDLNQDLVLMFYVKLTKSENMYLDLPSLRRGFKTS